MLTSKKVAASSSSLVFDSIFSGTGGVTESEMAQLKI